jgi:hypothetical protein
MVEVAMPSVILPSMVSVISIPTPVFTIASPNGTAGSEQGYTQDGREK